MAGHFALGVARLGYDAYVTNFNRQRGMGVFGAACGADPKARCGGIDSLSQREYVQVVTGLALLQQSGGNGPWAGNMLYNLLAAGRFAVNSLMYSDVNWIFRADAPHSIVWANRYALVRAGGWTVAHALAHEAGHFWFYGAGSANWQDQCQAETWAKGITGMFDPNNCSGG